MRLPGRLRRVLEAIARSFVLLVGLASLTAAGALFLLTQTVVGRDIAASLLEKALSDVVHGEVSVGPILGGNLVSRARVGRFVIAEEGGAPFLTIEGLRIEYNPLGFLFGSYRFHSAEADRVELELRQSADGRWNFGRLFGPPEGEEETGPPGRTRLLLTDLLVRSGRVTVRTPWARELQGSERAAEIEAALRGERVWRVRRIGPGRVERLIVLDSISGRFPLVRLVDPARPLQIEMEGIRARAAVVAQALDVRHFDGSAVFRDTIAVRIDRLETGASVLEGTGRVVPTTPTRFRFDLEADPIGFADLQWLPIPVPRSGGGPVSLAVYTRGPEATVVVDARDGDVRVDDSRVKGSFVIALEPIPRFELMDVRLRPVRLALVDELLQRERRIDGYIRGPLSGTGPINLMHLTGDLVLADLDGASAPSRLGIDGRVSVGEPKEMRDLRLEFSNFEPRWTAVVGIVTPLMGRVGGQATFNGFMGGAFSFEADVSHRHVDGSLSRVRGSGDVDLKGARTLDVRLEADPLALPTLEPLFEEGGGEIDLVGDVRGPLAARGPLSDLRIVADLRTPRGLLNFDGRFDLESAEKTYDAHLLARDIQLRQWVEHAPSTRLAVQGRLRGRGTDPRTLQATFDLTLLPSLVEGARVDTSLLRFTVGEGLATVDTFAIRTDAGRVKGRGAFGLAEGTSGSLVLDLESTDLSSWNRWLVPGRNPARRDTSIEALFEAFAEPGEGPPAAEELTEARDTLAGSMTGLGVLYGNVRRYSFGGRLFARQLSYGAARADSLRVTVDVDDPRRPDSFAARVESWGVLAGGLQADSVFLRGRRSSGTEGEVEVYARRDTSVELGAAGTISWAPEKRRAEIRQLTALLGRHRFALERPAVVLYGDSGFVARDVRIADPSGGLFELNALVPAEGAVDLTLRLQDVRLEDVLRLPAHGPELEGTLNVEARLLGTADEPLWDARIAVRNPVVMGIPFHSFQAALRYAERRIDVDASLDGDQRPLGRLEGGVLADLSLRHVKDRWGDDPIRLTILADSLPLEPLELAFASLVDVQGFGRGRVRISGRPGDISLDGRLSVREGGATIPYLGIRLLGVAGEIEFEDRTARIDSARVVSSKGGRGTIRGVIGLEHLRDPGFNLTFETRGMRAMDRRMARFLLNGEGHLGGSFRAPELTGRFRVSQGELRAERFLAQKQAVDLTDPDVYALLDTTLVAEQRLFERAQNPFMRNLRADLTLGFGPDLWLRSEALDVELSGEINVRMNRADRDLFAFGTLQLPRGKYRYVAGTGADLSSLYSRQLKIAGGSITFVGTPGMDPNLDIRAEYQTRTELGPVTITVHVTGTSLNPVMETSSEPPLPEADEVCYLLFSSACVGASDQGGEFAASLFREGLLGTVGNQFSQVLVSGVGLVDYFDIRSTGTGPPLESGAKTTNLLYGTEVEIGRYLTPQLFVRATQPLGGQLPGFSAEWSFSPRWRLELKTEDRFKRYASYGYSFSTFSERTWGLMLFREWNF